MINRLQWLLGVFGLIATLFLLGGCNDSLVDTTEDRGDITPPIHVNLSRAGVSYTPAQIRHAYGFDQLSNTGAGQTIAIVDAYGSPTIQKDLNTFCQKYGLPTTTITIAYPTGKPSKKDAGWALETALDVQWAHAVAPGAKILLVIAKTSSITNLLAAVDYAAKYSKQVSMSWGAAEFSGENSYDYHFKTPGVTFLAASGDSGSGVLWPAVSPSVVAVGGTTLTLDSTGNRIAETAWSGSGGGQSTVISEPTFQQIWQTSGFRQVPDVSYNGDPNTGFLVYSSTSYKGYKGWFVVGGTSAGAPQWAGLIALANASRATSLASANTKLYTLGDPTNQATNFFDILTGSNGGYQAKTGYDLVTGMGSPQAQAVVPGLIAAQ
ncbi:MAG: S53 family peptidase [Armatimonadota bacterium]